MTSALPSLVTILSAIAVLLVEADDALDPDNKIIGGKEVDIVTVPWQVSLTVTSISFFFCGGTIISERWIVSAAHCFDDVDTSDVTVRVGSNLHAAGGQTYQLEQVRMRSQLFPVTIVCWCRVVSKIYRESFKRIGD